MSDQVYHAALAAVPADLPRVTALVWDTGHTLSRQDQELFDELARELSQQVVDGQLGLSNHG